METDELGIRAIDTPLLQAYLLERSPPVLESDLLRRFFPESADLMLEGVSLPLYRVHFSLYHHLYRLAERLEPEGFLLHIRLIYVYLLKRPDSDRCAFFDADAVSFCGMLAEPGAGLCSAHRVERDRILESGSLGGASLRSFYLDPENIDAMDEETLVKFSRGVYRYAANSVEIDRCLRLLDLTEDFTLDRLKNRYRYLSKKHHPDLGGDRSVLFSDLTHAYHVLLSIRT